MKPDKKSQAFSLPVIKKLYDLGKIRINLDYQRESVWTKSQRQLLIDSLLRNFDIPKLYFRKLNEASEAFEVVDGQQRIRTIVDFYDGKFRLEDDADPLDGKEIKNSLISELPLDAMMALEMAQLDVVVLINYSDEQVRELFSRLQNGSSLNAAEKRHAWSGGMVLVVRELAKHVAFPDLCDFSSARYAYEDMAAKILHEIIADKIVDIRTQSIRATYESNKRITFGHQAVKRAHKVLNFLRTSLKGKTVKLKKYAIISLAILVNDLMDQYNLSKFKTEFSHWYENFELARLANNELDETDVGWDLELSDFTDNARNDSVAALNYRDKILRRRLFGSLVDLEAIDPTRAFSEDQRTLIFLRDGKKCKECSAEITLEEMHADHIKPHSAGGKTAVSNGRSLCGPCNLRKGATV